MKKQLKQFMHGAAASLTMVVALLLIITLKFWIYEPNIVNMGIQRIGG